MASSAEPLALLLEHKEESRRALGFLELLVWFQWRYS